MDPHVHCGTIYSSQYIQTPWLSVCWQMNGRSGRLLSQKRRKSCHLWQHRWALRTCAKSNKSDRDKRYMINQSDKDKCYMMLYALTHMRNLQKKKKNQEFPSVAQWLTNRTRNHEVAGLIPGLAQWVKDLALPWAVVWVTVVVVALAQAGSSSSDSAPSLGTSICHGVQP